MTNSWITKTIAVAFFITATVFFLRPVGDVDFPWHLKTGEYIFQHKEIPKTDPFSASSAESRTGYFLLSQYWLAQIIFYLVFSSFGPLGIVILRSLVFTGIIAILWASMRESPPLLKVAVLSLTVVLFTPCLGERPQFFSFLLTAAVIAIIENYRRTRSIKWLFFLPPIMLLWGNLHGGFIYGDVIIMIVCATETIKYFFIKKLSPPLEERKLLALLVTGFISIVVSYANPNNYYAFTFAIEGSLSPGIKTIREYISPLAETWGPFASRADFIYWVIMGYSLILLALNLRRLDITHLGVISFALLISLTAIRFVPFFVMIGLIASGQYRFGISLPQKYPFIERLKKPVNVLLLAGIIFWCGYLLHSHPGKEFLSVILPSRLYPERAAVFLEKKVPSAKMFNSHNIGSYLLLRLYPKFKVFTDTRGFNSREAMELMAARRWDGDIYSAVNVANELISKDYGRIEIELPKPAKIPQEPKWKKLLRDHGIEIIVHEGSNYMTGELYALPLSLIREDEWKLVYIDGQVMIFVKDIPKFKDLINKYELPKEKVYDEIGMENSGMLGSFHSPIYSSLAFSLIMKGAPDKDVEKYVRLARDLDRRNLLASYLEAFLEIKKQKD